MGELVAELLEDAPALRFVTLGGEKFKHYRKRTYQMINGYGPTENTVSSTEFRWISSMIIFRSENPREMSAVTLWMRL